MSNKLRFETSMDGTGFSRGVESLSHSLTHGLKGLVVQAAGIYGVEQALHKTIERADELVNSARRMGASVEDVQVFDRAAKDAASSISAIAKAFERVNVARAKALGGGAGSGKLLGDFGQLGVGRDDLKTKTAAELFSKEISAAVKNKSVEEIASAMRDIFGAGFGKLIPVLKTDFEELGAKMRRMGAIMDTETALKLKLAGEEMSLLSNIIMAQLAPAIVYVAEKLLWLANKIGERFAWLGTTFVPQARTTLDERDELAGLKGWMSSKGSFKDLMNNWQGLTKENEALLFKLDADGIRKFVQRRIDYLERKGKIADDVVEGVVKGNDETRKAIQDHIKELAEEIKHPKTPDFTKEEDANKKEAKIKQAKQPYSDALLQVGNFLGSGSGLISDIQRQQLAVQQQQLEVMNVIADKLDTLTETVAELDTGEDFGVPP